MRWAAVAACALAGAVLFQFFGNATRGYVNTPSMFWWWISQWLDPRAETEHGWLILGLSAWLLWRNRKAGRAAAPFAAANDRRRARCGAESAPGLALLAALALHALGFVAQQTRISILAFLLFTWGVLALADRRWARAAAFPLGFMVFAIPLNVLDSVGFWLRLWVIEAAGGLAHVAGIGLVRSGTQLFAADGRYRYDVAAACSGVRSLMALAALSLLIGYLNFRSGWRRGLMLALCLPLTYLGNVVRIGSIVLAAQAGGQAWGERAHDVMGYGVFAIVLGGVLGAARLLGRWRPEKDHGLRDPSANDNFLGCHVIRDTLPVVALAVGEMFFLGLRAQAPGRGAAGVRLAADGKNPVGLPVFLGTEWIGRRAEVTAVEREILPADTGFSRREYVNVSDPSHAVFLSIVLSGRDRTSIHRPELCLVGQGWTIAGAAAHAFAWPDPARGRVPATLLHLERADPAGNRKISALVAYWFVNSRVVVATHWQRFFHDAWDRVRHGRVDRWAYVLIEADARDGEAAALARMQAVLDGTLPVFQRVLAAQKPWAGFSPGENPAEIPRKKT